jgi:hypothetical protein
MGSLAVGSSRKPRRWVHSAGLSIIAAVGWHVWPRDGEASHRRCRGLADALQRPSHHLQVRNFTEGTGRLRGGGGAAGQLTEPKCMESGRQRERSGCKDARDSPEGQRGSPSPRTERLDRVQGQSGSGSPTLSSAGDVLGRGLPLCPCPSSRSDAGWGLLPLSARTEWESPVRAASLRFGFVRARSRRPHLAGGISGNSRWNIRLVKMPAEGCRDKVRNGQQTGPG